MGVFRTTSQARAGWGRLPLGMKTLLISGVICLFAPIGLLIMMVNRPVPAVPLAVMYGLITGLIAAGWAWTFTARRYWALPLVIAFQVLAPAFLVPLVKSWPMMEVDADGSAQQARAVWMAVLCGVCIVAAYIQLFLYARIQELSAARSRAELDVASRMHASIVPDLQRAGPIAEVIGRSAASSDMGGDLIDMVATSDRLDLYLADVSGHGVKAGVVMAMLKSSLRMRLLRPADLGAVLTDLNRVLDNLVEPGMFATASCLRVKADRTCEVAMAGHLPLVCWREAERRIELIDNEHLPLGVEGGHEYQSRAAGAAPGDIFMLLTDGLIEVQDGGGKELGMDPVIAAFAQAAGDGRSLAAVHAAVLQRAEGHGRQLDDQTLVLLRVL